MGQPIITAICTGCRTSFSFAESNDAGRFPNPTECGTCAKLGSRGLVKTIRRIREATSEFERECIREAFAAAKGRSYTPFEKGEYASTVRSPKFERGM